MQYVIGFLLLTVAAMIVFVACDHQDMDEHNIDI